MLANAGRRGVMGTRPPHAAPPVSITLVVEQVDDRSTSLHHGGLVREPT